LPQVARVSPASADKKLKKRCQFRELIEDRNEIVETHPNEENRPIEHENLLCWRVQRVQLPQQEVGALCFEIFESQVSWP
jgi:hypothetical protein